MMLKKQKFDVNPENPEIAVRYIGKTQTFVATGSGCTHGPVQRIWDNSPSEKNMRRASMSISSDGILLRDLEKRNVEVMFDIRAISFCAAEQAPHERVFAWIARRPSSPNLYCYAVLCPTKEKAQDAAVQLSRAFQNAYQDNINIHRKAGVVGTGSTPRQSRGGDIIPMFSGNKSVVIETDSKQSNWDILD